MLKDVRQIPVWDRTICFCDQFQNEWRIWKCSHYFYSSA